MCLLVHAAQQPFEQNLVGLLHDITFEDSFILVFCSFGMLLIKFAHAMLILVFTHTS